MNNTPTRGMQILEWLEGNIYQVYADPIGHATECMGIRTNAPLGTKRDKAYCDTRNFEEYTKYENFVRSVLRVDQTEHQVEALILLCYNIGRSAFNSSTLLRMINRGKPAHQVVGQFHRWNKVTINGRKSENRILTKRRTIEAAIYLSNFYADEVACADCRAAPRPHRPDTEGLLALIRNSKTAWSGGSLSLLGATTPFIEKIHPLTINIVALTLFVSGVWFIYNRYKDEQNGEHLDF